MLNEKVVLEYPYLKEYSKSTIFVTEEDYLNIRNSEPINIGQLSIPKELIVRILNDDNYFNYVFKYFNKEINSFQINYIINGDTGPSLSYKKSAILKAINIYLKQNNKTSLEQERYQTLKNCVSYDTFKKDKSNQIYKINIDNTDYEINTNDFIKFLELNDEEYDEALNKDFIFNIKIEHFIYALCSFLKGNSIHSIFQDYMFPNHIADRIKKLRANEVIDTESLNKHLETTDKRFKNVEIDPDLKKEIIKDIPANFNNLEKAIYIYIKMCRLLTYDEEYFAVNQKGKSTEKHKNIDYVKQINLKNNKLVCFEFNIIYSKLLNELGLNFSSEYKGMIGEAYGDAHANLEFRYEKFLVKADSVTSILCGDLLRAKTNDKLVGLSCLNKNEDTKKEFEKILYDVYKVILTQEQDTKKFYSFEEILKEYNKLSEKVEITLKEKLSILIDKVNNANMVGVDTMSYLLSLRKVLFNEIEREKNIKIVIIRNNDLKETNAVIIINKKDYNEEDENIYYLYRPNQLLISVSKEELNERFNDNKLQYIEANDPKIPGINGGIKK